jgi:AcrR family transcriptional regulator
LIFKNSPFIIKVHKVLCFLDVSTRQKGCCKMAKARELQKARKKLHLIQAAYQCFSEKGIHKSSIDDIVSKANVAKGTFYLYFKDKKDLSEQLCLELSKTVLLSAYHSILQRQVTDYEEIVISFVDAIIEYFKNHKNVLTMLEKNFSWPVIQKHLAMPETEESEEFQNIAKLLLHNPYRPNEPRETTMKYIFSIIALCGSVGYSSIIQEEPDTIDNMKPILYDMIIKIIQ